VIASLVKSSARNRKPLKRIHQITIVVLLSFKQCDIVGIHLRRRMLRLTHADRRGSVARLDERQVGVEILTSESPSEDRDEEGQHENGVF
jgi:hypothetical protein